MRSYDTLPSTKNCGGRNKAAGANLIRRSPDVTHFSAGGHYVIAQRIIKMSDIKKNRRKNQYKELKKSESLAELVGVILGDGNLYKHERTERLRIICNSRDAAYIEHIKAIMQHVFHKTPSIIKRKGENTVDVSLYQCQISKRLNILTGSKIKNNIGIPFWIFSNKKYVNKCLKGLFETDGCFVEDRGNYTQIIEFKNNCGRLRKEVYNILKRLDFNPQLGSNYVRLARKNEVYRFKELISFRNYN